MDSLLAASLSLHQDTSALMPSGRHAPGSVLGALPTWPQPCEVRQWEVFISIPISPVRKLGLTGIELTAQGPTAKCQSQAGLYTAGGETRKTTRCARAVLRSECRSVRRRRSFPWPGSTAKGSSEKTCQLVRPRGGGAHRIWKCLHGLQRTHKHGLPSLRVNILYAFCSPGKY